MAEDLVKELRSIVADGDMYGVKAEHPTSIHLRTRIEKAADRSEALEAENARLREALEPLAKYHNIAKGFHDSQSLGGFSFTAAEIRAARSALTGKGA